MTLYSDHSTFLGTRFRPRCSPERTAPERRPSIWTMSSLDGGEVDFNRFSSSAVLLLRFVFAAFYFLIFAFVFCVLPFASSLVWLCLLLFLFWFLLFAVRLPAFCFAAMLNHCLRLCLPQRLPTLLLACSCRPASVLALNLL